MAMRFISRERASLSDSQSLLYFAKVRDANSSETSFCLVCEANVDVNSESICRQMEFSTAKRESNNIRAL